ncbi:MAG: hypothetical protein ABH826_01915 [Patescibacteria group bacterium]
MEEETEYYKKADQEDSEVVFVPNLPIDINSKSNHESMSSTPTKAKLVKNPFLLIVIGIVLVLLGNYIAEFNAISDIVGTGIGLFGDLLIIYAIFLAIKWLWGKVVGKEKPEQKSE